MNSYSGISLQGCMRHNIRYILDSWIDDPVEKQTRTDYPDKTYPDISHRNIVLSKSGRSLLMKGEIGRIEEYGFNAL